MNKSWYVLGRRYIRKYDDNKAYPVWDALIRAKLFDWCETNIGPEGADTWRAEYKPFSRYGVYEISHIEIYDEQVVTMLKLAIPEAFISTNDTWILGL